MKCPNYHTHTYTHRKYHLLPTAYHSKHNRVYTSVKLLASTEGEQQYCQLYLTSMVLLAYKENSSNKDKPRLKKKISPCPAVSQSESRSHLVNCINTLNLVNSPQFRWQFKQVCFILSYNLSWVPFQNWVAIFNLKFHQSYSLKALGHPPSEYLYSYREDWISAISTP